MAINGQLNRFAELEHLRMSRDWTYRELAASITATTHKSRAEDCWRRICQGLTPKPNRRTMNILEAYLASIQATRRRPARATVRRLVRKAS